MGVPGSVNNLLGISAGGYQISRSLRFNSADSAYLSRTPGSAGNRKTWTWAGWVKRSGSNRACLFSGGTTTSDAGFTSIEFESDGTLRVTGWNTLWAKSNALYRDYSAWYHVCVAFDSTQASAANQIKIYVNGSQITKATENALSQNSDYGINQAARHTIGAISEDANASFNNFYLAEVFFIDGSALTPSSFTETDATTDQLIPKAYSGSYGTNGFHLELADNSSLTTSSNVGIGKDTSGNGNYWVTNNLSVTAGAGNDSLVDVPTNGSQTDTGVGAEVRGNYATLSPLLLSDAGGTTSGTLSNGNLDYVNARDTYFGTCLSTIGVSSGKWYFEGTASGSSSWQIGIYKINPLDSRYNSDDEAIGYSANGYGYQNNGNKQNNLSSSSYGATYTAGDVVGVALDLDAGTLVFYKNGTSQGTAYSSLSGTYAFGVSASTSGSGWSCNFGQRAFAYAAPSGYKALCTANLPEPTIKKGNTAMDVKLYTGNGSSQSITGLGFNPDLVWLKRRSGSNNHGLFDWVRGVSRWLSSNLTDAEDYISGSYLTAFNTDGFTIGGGGYNDSSSTYVAWCWDAGSSTDTNNTAGSITSSVRANATAGFSVVTYTVGNNTSQTIGHGLGVAPQLIIVKERNQANNWQVYHASLGNGSFLYLNATNASATNNLWNNTSPTSTVFSIRSGGSANFYDGKDHVAYCFAPVAGYSAMGSFQGNGSSDGPYIHLGFRPRFFLYKRTDAASDWWMFDSARKTYNPTSPYLFPNLSDAEGDDNNWWDFLASGVKMRGRTDSNTNNASGTYIYAAFAEAPLKYSRAR